MNGNNQLEGFPSPFEAAQYIKRHLTEFTRAGPKLLQLQHDAILVRNAARDRGDGQGTGDAQLLYAKLTEMRNQWVQAMEYLDRLPALVPGLGVVIAPLALWAAGAAVMVVSVAAVIIKVINGMPAAERGLQLIERGTATPEQIANVFERIETGGSSLSGDVGGIMKMALIGGIALMAFQFAKTVRT